MYSEDVLTVVNSTFVSNAAGYDGGAVYVYGNLVMNNCTVTGNTAASQSGGVEGYYHTITSSIIVGNSAPTYPDTPDAGTGAPGYNVVGGTAAAAGLDPTGLRYNGGPTPTIALFRNGTAVDAGDPNFAAPPSYDQRGPGFARKFGARIDIGAFERQAVNSPPVPGVHSLTRYAARGVGVPVATLLAADYDPDGDALTITAVGAATSGHATVSLANGHLYYDPQPGFAAADSFTYQIADGYGGSVTATVAVNVLADAAPPDEATISRISGTANGGGTETQLSFHLEAGRSYRVQYTGDLTQPNGWQLLWTATADADGRFQVVDHGPLPSRRFYRAIYP